MISLNASSLFSATNAKALKSQIERHIDQAVGERDRNRQDELVTDKGSIKGGKSNDAIYKRLMSLGLSGDAFDGAAKNAAGADALSDYMDKARTVMNQKAAAEKLQQSRRRISELEQEARQAAAKGDGAKLARIAREAAGITKGLAAEAKGIVEGQDASPAERAAAIAAGEGDPNIRVAAQPGMTAGGVTTGFARSYVQEVRDVAGRARTMLTQAETQRAEQRGRPLTEEERKEREEELRAARDDLAASDQILTRLQGALGDANADAAGSAEAAGEGGADALVVTQTYVRTETITIAVAFSETSVSVTA
ncbi:MULTISPECIES: hypothetical protein [unclassified Azospirillum]|uniref:hypothetical protein n=1 Tax=unclassified Azospirillum TaxID=2630922 RepID=UPI000B6F7E50|nr:MULTISPECIES: hypothetical protein [unclassified Azospirillum]SNS42216.1 hypothetical protein SAMN05880556_104350 [Azospirillum sp. RU38E]SNS60887.1 hypothetical protein SAMN05880591_104350 [Azospirillum sp. RU37A]